MNAHSASIDTMTLTGALLNALAVGLVFVAYFALTFLLADLVKTTHKHATTGNEFHPDPFPLHLALIVALVEVCVDKPYALHRSRMETVRRIEANRIDPNRIDAIEDAMLRHPSNARARRAAMQRHPSARAPRVALVTGSGIA